MLELLLWCYSIPGVGSRLIVDLWKQFHNASDPVRGALIELRRRMPSTGSHIKTYDTKKSDELLKLVQRYQCEVVPFWDDAYPRVLKEIPDYPAFLFVRGAKRIPPACAGIVGTRMMTVYGKQVVGDLVGGMDLLSGSGHDGEEIGEQIGMVSGLAYGVDAAVHSAVVTREARGLIPIAVLPGGPPRGFPFHNKDVFEGILKQGGSALWEFLPETPVSRELFACRNRIIAGLSQGVVVVESDVHGGSLITAQLALDYGREVGAVPGSIYSRYSRGTNQLIADGAQVVRNAEDVMKLVRGVDDHDADQESYFSNLGNERVRGMVGKELKIDDELAASIVERFAAEGMSLDELSVQCGLGPASVRRGLTKLELKGILRRNPAGLITLGERLS